MKRRYSLAKRKRKPAKRTFKNQPLAQLAKLKKTLQEHNPPIKTNTPPDPPQENDASLFSQAMSDVEPIKGRSSALPPAPKMRSRKMHEEVEAEEVMQALQDLIEGEAPLFIHETDEAIEGAVEGLEPQILKKLRKGEFSIQDHLDLHRHNRDEAREKVELFLNNAILQGKRCVLIIHGRGHGSKDHIPVLKNALRNWFTRRGLRKKVLAFTTARPADGGAGAIYVLLRKYQPLR